MENSKQHFLEAWADTKETCVEMGGFTRYSQRLLRRERGRRTENL